MYTPTCGHLESMIYYAQYMTRIYFPEVLLSGLKKPWGHKGQGLAYVCFLQGEIQLVVIN